MFRFYSPGSMLLSLIFGGILSLIPEKRRKGTKEIHINRRIHRLSLKL